MLKKMILTWYAACYLRNKKAKTAKEFSHYWLTAFVQVAVSAFAFLVVIDVLNYGIFGVNGIFGIRPAYNKVTFLLFFAVIPAGLLYYLIFHKYGVDKNATDEDFDYLNIDKKKRTVVFFFCVFINVLMLLTMYIVYSKILFRHRPASGSLF